MMLSMFRGFRLNIHWYGMKEINCFQLVPGINVIFNMFTRIMQPLLHLLLKRQECVRKEATWLSLRRVGRLDVPHHIYERG